MFGSARGVVVPRSASSTSCSAPINASVIFFSEIVDALAQIEPPREEWAVQPKFT